MDCIHRNGIITGYSVQYGVVGTAQEDRTVETLQGFHYRHITISGLALSCEYSVEVAAVNSAGIGVYSDIKTSARYLHQGNCKSCMSLYIQKRTHAIYSNSFTATDVYLSLNGDIIPNHGYVLVSDIGFTASDALICNTNRTITGAGYSGGDWIAPDGTRVNSTTVPGFWRNRGAMVVRLLRTTPTDPPVEGIYQCTILDATLTEQVLSVGLYHNEGGIIITLLSCIIMLCTFF